MPIIIIIIITHKNIYRLAAFNNKAINLRRCTFACLVNVTKANK